ncbi:hypothetical protein [Streptomyces violascens]|uniref:Uncharacterized protein n=1 Tax=Streptomyces violascens TaxID=67381 RepID=A0ABQ3QX65_9ACTN|nr:hypothetical protein [Streptomyces violascens]GGU12948.1 hypothetical protein GCM10010289_38220 [Streptomyces violascens]GHI41872.1 hypothetical protein Sviol_62800 [Streptomyces violascens]
MTGPEHYREAERLIAVAVRSDQTTYEGENPEADRTLAEAQVHATLALAAATALVDETPRSDSHSEYRAWQSVAGSPYQGPGEAR